MTRERAKELLPIIKAFAEGKVIQYKNAQGEWVDSFYQMNIDFDRSSTSYRVSPEKVSTDDDYCGCLCSCGG